MITAQQIIPHTKEIVFLSSSGSMNKEKHRLYLFITPTVEYLCCQQQIITDSEKINVFDEAVQKQRDYPEL